VVVVVVDDLDGDGNVEDARSSTVARVGRDRGLAVIRNSPSPPGVRPAPASTGIEVSSAGSSVK
jgi:hypothetical protein